MFLSQEKSLKKRHRKASHSSSQHYSHCWLSFGQDSCLLSRWDTGILVVQPLPGRRTDCWLNIYFCWIEHFHFKPQFSNFMRAVAHVAAFKDVDWLKTNWELDWLKTNWESSTHWGVKVQCDRSNTHLLIVRSNTHLLIMVVFAASERGTK